MDSFMFAVASISLLIVLYGIIHELCEINKTLQSIQACLRK